MKIQYLLTTLAAGLVLLLGTNIALGEITKVNVDLYGVLPVTSIELDLQPGTSLHSTSGITATAIKSSTYDGYRSVAYYLGKPLGVKAPSTRAFPSTFTINFDSETGNPRYLIYLLFKTASGSTGSVMCSTIDTAGDISNYEGNDGTCSKALSGGHDLAISYSKK